MVSLSSNQGANNVAISTEQATYHTAYEYAEDIHVGTSKPAEKLFIPKGIVWRVLGVLAIITDCWLIALDGVGYF